MSLRAVNHLPPAPASRGPEPTLSARASQAAGALLVRDGDTVEASGSVFAAPGRPVQQQHPGRFAAPWVARPDGPRCADEIMRRLDPVMQDRRNGVYSAGGDPSGRVSVDFLVPDQQLYDAFARVGLNEIILNPWIHPISP